MKLITRFLLLSFVLLAPASGGRAAEKIVWKPVALAVLKVDERPAKIWEVYVAQKREHLVLVQLGRRNLVLDTELREVVEIPPAALQRKGKDLLWERAEKHNTEGAEAPFDSAQGRQRTQRKDEERALATADWWIRDAGRARIIRVRLKEEGRVLEVQLPLRPDLRILY